MPKVSVIIPTYNRSQLIDIAIKSVLEQTYRDFEIIVADDGSTDGTPSLLESYGQSIRKICMDHTGQPATARNAGIHISQGKFIAFLDSDDRWLPDKLAQQVDILESNHIFGFICSNAWIENDKKPLGRYRFHPPSLMQQELNLENLLRNNMIITSSVMIRRELLDKSGTFDPDPRLSGMEDYDLWLRLAVITSIYYLSLPLLVYSSHQTSLGKTLVNEKQWEMQTNILHKFRKYLEENNLEQNVLDVWIREKSANITGHLCLSLLANKQAGKAMTRAYDEIRQNPSAFSTWIGRRIKHSLVYRLRDQRKYQFRPKPGGVRLHLGCGQIYFPGYINIDYPPSEHTVQQSSVADEYADITALSYPADSIQEIRLHHVLEHFDRATALRLLIDWYDWLEEGGKLVIETPDFYKCVGQYRHSNLKIKHKILRHLFGSHEAAWAIHLDGWDQRKFKTVLPALGFCNLQFLNSKWQDIYNITVLAHKRPPFTSRSDRLKSARDILALSLIDQSPSERVLFDIWISKLNLPLQSKAIETRVSNE